MPALLPTLLLGIVLGVRHATDADHVVAVTAIVSRERSVRSAMRVGALWGAGHTLTILLVGSGLIALGLVVPARLGLALEFAVAVMLVALGGWSMRRSHQPDCATRSAARPVLVGVVHGLAGSAAITLLVLATIPNVRWAAGYLALFGAGTIIGMVAVTAAVAAPLVLTAVRFERYNRGLRLASGALSVAFGLALAAHVTLVGGLFAAHPLWVPH